MKKFIIEFLQTFRIGPQHVRLGVAKYADSPNLEFDLTAYADTKALEEAVEAIKQLGGGTETGKALEFMVPQFDRAMVTRGGKVREYLVVITDGKSTDEVKVPANKLRAQGVTIYAIGVKDADKEELHEISGNPKRTFMVNNFDALRPIKDDILTDICSQDGKTERPSGSVAFKSNTHSSARVTTRHRLSPVIHSYQGSRYRSCLVTMATGFRRTNTAREQFLGQAPVLGHSGASLSWAPLGVGHDRS